MEYQLPQTYKKWSHIERQAGGRVKGMGEKQIEVDKRILRTQLCAGGELEIILRGAKDALYKAEIHVSEENGKKVEIHVSEEHGKKVEKAKDKRNEEAEKLKAKFLAEKENVEKLIRRYKKAEREMMELEKVKKNKWVQEMEKYDKDRHEWEEEKRKLEAQLCLEKVLYKALWEENEENCRKWEREW